MQAHLALPGGKGGGEQLASGLPGTRVVEALCHPIPQGQSCKAPGEACSVLTKLPPGAEFHQVAGAGGTRPRLGLIEVQAGGPHGAWSALEVAGR